MGYSFLYLDLIVGSDQSVGYTAFETANRLYADPLNIQDKIGKKESI